MIRAILFDLDGLLTDTEALHCRAYQRALAAVGYTLTEEEFFNHWVRDGLAIADLCRLRQLPHKSTDLHNSKMVFYKALLETELQPMPGAVELLNRVHGRKAMALVTASAKESAYAVLEGLGITRYFSVVLTANDVTRRKPHPDVFLKASEMLGIPPAECVVLEDAEKGIIAAHSAGMQSIAVPTHGTRGNDFSLATHVAESLAAIPDAWLGL